MVVANLILLQAPGLWAEIDLPEEQYEKAVDLRCCPHTPQACRIISGSECHQVDKWICHAWRLTHCSCWCRSRDDASTKQLRRAADLLKSAAGVSLGVSLPVEQTALNNTDAEGIEAKDDILSRHFAGLEIAENGHVGALKELAVCYELGTPPTSNVQPSHLLCSSAWRSSFVCADASRAYFRSCRGWGSVQPSGGV